MMINISASSPSFPKLSNNVVAEKSRINSQVDSSTAYLTEDDISTLERVFGKSNLEDLKADPDGLKTLQTINKMRQRGVIQGSLANYMPEANLTAADARLLERLTGCKSIHDATRSSFDALSLMMNVADTRLDGSLVGDISTDYLQNLREASALAAKAKSQSIASMAFIQKAVAAIQAEIESKAGTLDKTV
jgi:hypothetical protein